MRYDIRSGICRIGKSMHDTGLIAGRAGNLSARIGDTILITPRGARKDTLHPTDLVAIRLDSDETPARASTELPLHRSAYLASPDVGAVLHAHAPALIAAGLRGLDLTARLPEVTEAVGSFATVDFAPSGSEELGRAVGAAVADGATIVLLYGHGAVAIGSDIDEAYDRLELAELAAYAVVLAQE
ncbi:MAG: hypothetical protein GWP04_08340 [Gammaproteobacteria bacterium]|nr:hypothetical protein [Gammaproteobacteria bacterium]